MPYHFREWSAPTIRHLPAGEVVAQGDGRQAPDAAPQLISYYGKAAQGRNRSSRVGHRTPFRRRKQRHDDASQPNQTA